MPQVTIVPTGESFSVDPGEPVLTAALRMGLNLPHSCKGGHCASCRARLLSGETTYPTRALPPGITPEEAAEGFVLLCQAQAITDITVETREMRLALEVEVKSLPSRIDRMERLADDVMAVFLRLPAVEDLHYRAGQYIDFILSGGRRRSFSLASAPGDGKMLEVHVRRASSSGFTGQLFDTMRAGTLLRVEGPLGQFWFRGDSPRHAVMIGGGTGYAPLRAMLRQLLAIGDRRPITLYWGARTTRDLYEHNWLSNVAADRAAFDYRPVLSDPQTEVSPWTGRVGLVHEAALADLGDDLTKYDVYASGPPAMVEAIRHTFVERGLPRAQLFFDSFDYAPDTLAAMRKADDE
ncbi:MAG: 2Fe-2S iron-sulfur cluster-binding protein [Gammaproteobacteria bacterium]|nr:2Fe-2S iron-sulfur cluster-binding protein [Gammaproteobacteria bacterium]MDH4310613.1 2Fe-2S iron-sulfur cluster-binding protein [Gammaproteobacteria bacterium]MDH5271815.1 2Fe-2S iron-sulfur cluster-binding protein [Gammaproteobacteria bacterium]